MEKPLMQRFLFYVKENYEQYCAKVVVMEQMFILQKYDGESRYNKLFYEIKKELFQTEKEYFCRMI